MALLITDEYREQNRLLHEQRADYGIIGHRWGPVVREIAEEFDVRTILDYGCGKGTLKKALTGYKVYEYDPALGIDERRPVDLVVCTDVLEHVEPACLDNVLADIDYWADRALIVVATAPSDKTLPDGRNAHLIVEDEDYWIDVLRRHFANFNLLNSRENEVAFETW